MIENIKVEPGFACAHRKPKEYVDEYVNNMAKDFKVLCQEFNSGRENKTGSP